MFEKQSEIRQVVQHAKEEEKDAKNATDVVTRAVDKMNPLRNAEDKSQNLR